MKSLTRSGLVLTSLLCSIASTALQAADESPTYPHEHGRWSPLVDWPLIAIHAVMTPEGKIFSFGTNKLGAQGASFYYDVWDPDLGTSTVSHNTLPNTLGVDSFCSAALVMPENRNILMSGGDNRPNGAANMAVNDAPTFNTQTGALSRAADMNSARWYPSATVLPNGEILLNGGRDGTGRPVNTPEIYSPATNKWRSLMGVSTVGYGFFYPRQWVAPDGRLFVITINKRMYYVDATGNGQLRDKGKLDVAGSPYDGTAVMYQPGKILQVGGSGLNANLEAYHNSTKLIDITSGDPVVTEVADPVETGRIWADSVILPNGKVIIVGGSGKKNVLTDVAVRPEIWDPADSSWSQMAPSSTARLYHSTALLLKDGRVLVAGGGAPGPLKNLNAELYSPPYLFNSSGPAERPNIMTAPDEAPYGSKILVRHSNNDTVSRVTLVKTGAVTHSFNMEQRFVELDFTTTSQGVNVTLPDSANIATPGFYMLHLINDMGVPSEAHMIRLSSTATLDTTVGPYPVAVADTKTAKAGIPAKLDVLSNDTGNGNFLSEIFQYTEKGATTRISSNKVVYTARPDFNGTDSFWYSVEDNQGRTTSAKVTVTVSGETTQVDVHPVALADAVTNSGGGRTTIDVLANDAGNNLALAAPDVWSQKGGSVLWEDDKIVYTPKPGFNGVDKIWYVIRDTQGRTNSGEVTITVRNNNVIDAASYPSAAPDVINATQGEAIIIDALANDTGVDLTLVAPDAWSLKGGSVTLLNNKIVYTPAASFSGTDKIWYVLSDAQGRTNSGEVTVFVAASTDPAILNRVTEVADNMGTNTVSASTTVNEAVTIDVFAEKTETGLSLEKLIALSLKQGRVTQVGNKITYTPKAGFIGPDKVWYVFKNAQGRTYNGEVDIDVAAKATNSETTTDNTDADAGSDGGGGSFSWLLITLFPLLALRRFIGGLTSTRR